MPSYPQTIVKTIDYESPSGKVYIGKYLPPFEKAEGFGFVGIILEDTKTGQLQCHECGKWYENLATHILSHKFDINEYRDKFGLSQTTALKSKRMRLIQSRVMTELRKNNPQNNFCFSKNNQSASNRKGKPKSKETKNKYGVCDLQILDKIKVLYDKIGKTPSLTELKEEYGGGFVTLISQRYGSYIHYCRKNGFIPVYSKDNPKYSREYFIEKAKNMENVSFGNFNINESRSFYRYFNGGIKELRQIIENTELE